MQRIVCAALCAVLAGACKPKAPGGEKKAPVAPGEMSATTSAAPDAASSTAAPKALTPPDGNARLDRTVVPTLYRLELDVDPRKKTFSGRTTIRAKLARAARSIRLHAEKLTISGARVVAGGTTHAAKVVVGNNGGLRLDLPADVPAGPLELRLEYSAPLPEQPLGIYRVKDRGEWYVFTQFEPLEARKAFPCFDQPEFKTPYEVKIRVPRGQKAFSNGPETGPKQVGDRDEYTFARTPPLPTYLVAFAIGPLEVAPAPTQEGLPPMRVITTKGKTKFAAWANRVTVPILRALIAYFGRKYPYAKLDQVAVPNFAAGAMENAGLVTYREQLLLLDGKTAPPRARMWGQGVIAHELAHMWFGNLVTLAWWNDLWLNEAMATWVAVRTVAKVAPTLEIPLEHLTQLSRVMSGDAQKHARAVRQPIRHGGDVYNAFDGITYRKGSALLSMMESWVGAEPFRKGIRDYLTRHTWGNATTADLLAALEKASGKPVTKAIQWFLDQPGTPLLTLVPACMPGRPARILVTQTRYRPSGSTAPLGRPWQVPFCVRHGGPGRKPSKQCFMLPGRAGTFNLAGQGCPVWLHPNHDERGYYRWKLPPQYLEALVGAHRAQLTIKERVSLPGHLQALLEARAIDVPTYVGALGKLAGERHRKVVAGVAGGLATLHRLGLPTAEKKLRLAFAKLVKRWLGPHLRRVGFLGERRPGATPADLLLRRSLVGAYTRMAGPAEPALAGRVVALAKRLLADPAKGSLGDFSLAVPLAARFGKADLFELLRRALPQAPSPVHRGAIVSAFGRFRDPALLVRSLGLLLDGTLRAQDLFSVVRGVGAHPPAVNAAWDWLTRNYARVVELIGEKFAPRLPWMGGGFCTVADRAKVEKFFSVKTHAPAGTQHNLNLVLELIERCVRLRAAVAAPLAKYLAKL